MKRLLALLMLLALPAHAARVAVVKPFAMPGSATPNEYGFAERDLRGCLDALGMDYDILPQSCLIGNSGSAQDLDLGLGAGSISIGGVARQYGAAVHFWWTAAAYGVARAPGYNPDTLTRVAAWPTKPQLYIGPTVVGGSTQWSTNSACSTGIGAGSVSLPFGDGEGSQKVNGRHSSMYLAGNQLMWKNWQAIYPLGLSTTASWPGITRGLVGVKTVLAANSTGSYENCNSCDGGSRSDPPDSVSVWYRQRTTGTGAPYGSRLIFAWPAAQGGANGAIMLTLMALCALDSSAGGTLIGQVPGWTPQKLAIFLDKALYHSNYTTSGNDDDHGLYRPDSTKTWAMVDSLDALGVPYTVGYQADRDTIRTYPYELVRLKRLRNAKFSPQVYRGTFTTNAIGEPGRSNARNRVDVWGTQRTRLLYASPPPYTPTTTDSSVFAGLWYMGALTDSLFPGRRSRSFYQPRGDWVANQHTRANLPDKNEVAKAVWYAGGRVMLLDPDNPDVNPNPSFATATAGTFVGASTNIDGLFAAERRVNVYSDSTYSLSGGGGGASQSQQAPVGSVFFAGIRGMRAESGALNLSVTHNYTEELLWGALTANWYRTDIAYYYHYFHTPLRVLMIPIGSMGGDATGNNRAAGWWQIKHLVNQVKAANKLAGRTVISIVDAGDL